MIDRFPMADESPPHGELLMSELGELWVGDYPGPLAIIPTLRPPSRRWKVFDDAGVLAATVEPPEGFKAHALRGALIYGVYVDELGVESVRAYRVVRD